MCVLLLCQRFLLRRERFNAVLIRAIGRRYGIHLNLLDAQFAADVFQRLAIGLLARNADARFHFDDLRAIWHGFTSLRATGAECSSDAPSARRIRLQRAFRAADLPASFLPAKCRWRAASSPKTHLC